MNRRKGFITVTIMLVMSVMFIMVSYLCYEIILESLILDATANNIQSYYLAEGKAYMTVCEEKYYTNQLYPMLLDVFRKNNFGTKKKEVRIQNEDLYLDDDMNHVKILFTDKNNRKELILNAESNYHGVCSKVTASSTLVNELFEIQDAILDNSKIINHYEEDFKALLEKISDEITVNNCNNPDNMFAMEYLDFHNIYLHKKGIRNFEISADRNSMENPYIERFDKQHIFLICRNNKMKLNVFLGEPEKPTETIKLFGVLFVEGNLIISSNLEFYGIIIVKNGEINVNSESQPKINGLMLFDNVANYNDFVNNADIIYDARYVYIYGTYLPGFLEPRMNLIKSN